MNNETQQVQLTAYPLETLVSRRDELQAIIKESETLLKAINDDLLERVLLSSDKKLALEDSRFVQIVTRTSFSKVPMEYARSVGAIKETIDSTMLAPLFNKGVVIPGATQSDYILIK
jgi:hypothetical protein